MITWFQLWTIQYFDVESENLSKDDRKVISEANKEINDPIVGLAAFAKLLISTTALWLPIIIFSILKKTNRSEN